jgi:hypothetical protein
VLIPPAGRQAKFAIAVTRGFIECVFDLKTVLCAGLLTGLCGVLYAQDKENDARASNMKQSDEKKGGHSVSALRCERVVQCRAGI